MSMLSFGVSSVFFHFSTVLLSSVCLVKISKAFVKFSSKMSMSSKDLQSFIVF
jgi:hypothetical protein